MANPSSLYAELKEEFQELAGPLMDFAADQLQKRNAFLPFGATRAGDGTLTLQAAAPSKEVASSEEVLPLLLKGMNGSAKKDGCAAVAVCEWVKIGTGKSKMVDAVKVQIHHRRGLALAFYLPATKKGKVWEFGDMVVQPAEKIVTAWGNAGET